MKRALLTAAALLLSTARKRGSDRSPNWHTQLQLAL